MDFSLICPTRGRTYCIERLLESLAHTVADVGNTELLFGVDNDDVLTQDFINNLARERKYPINMHMHCRERSLYLNNDYYNWLASKTTGRYIWVIGDDVVFLVEKWDRLIISKLNQYLADKPDHIFCAGIKDDTPKPKPSLPMFPCFPLVSRDAYEAMGFVLHPFIPTWGADYLIYLLYQGASRYLSIDDMVYLSHISIHTHTAPKDETATHIEQTFNQLKMNPEHNIDRHAEQTIPGQIEELRQKVRMKGGRV